MVVNSVSSTFGFFYGFAMPPHVFCSFELCPTASGMSNITAFIHYHSPLTYLLVLTHLPHQKIAFEFPNSEKHIWMGVRSIVNIATYTYPKWIQFLFSLEIPFFHIGCSRKWSFIPRRDEYVMLSYDVTLRRWNNNTRWRSVTLDASLTYSDSKSIYDTCVLLLTV